MWIGAACAGAAVADDVLVGRDGERSSGRLQACIADRCQWAGGSVLRSRIGWIGLGPSVAEAPPSPLDPRADTVWLRDGRAITSPVVGISAGEVVTDAESFDRGDVTWVYFGSPDGVPPHTASSPQAPPASSPPTLTPGTPPPGGLAASRPTAAPAAESTAQAQPAAAALLLNEVCFVPAENQMQFVEIRNASTAPVALDGVSLRNEKGKTFELPKGLTLDSEALLLVVFGSQPAGPNIVNAPPQDFLGRESGALRLQGAGVADRVTWGLPDLSSVELCRGGRCAPPAPGSVIARLPDAVRPLTAAAWAPLDPALATPGKPNPRPPVSVFAALPGMMFVGPTRFSWYGVPGTVSYRLQVARDEEFATLVHQASIPATAGVRLEQLTAHGPELPAGSYFWRVQAVGAGGQEAAFSTAVPFGVRAFNSADAVRAEPSELARAGGFGRSRARFQGDEARSASGPAVPPFRVCPGILGSGATTCKELPVPVIKHQKDTKMLTLEARSEDPPWSWDTPDFAGYPYCARAGVQMVSAYYHVRNNVPGKLSQDRIGYEVFDHLRTGPEYDLPVVGIINQHTTQYSLPLAFGTSGTYHHSPYPFESDGRPCGIRNRRLGCGETGPCPRCSAELQYGWGYHLLYNIKQEIDAERPLIVTGPGHLYLVVGYAEKGEEFSIIEQDAGGRNEVNLQRNGEVLDMGFVDGHDVVQPLDGNEAVTLQTLMDAYWTGIAPVRLGSDERDLELSTDSDEDGVLDFDERRRFKTKPNDPDSDDDGVEDKDEIRYSVWDPDHGYHRGVASLAPTGSYADTLESARNADLSGRDPDRDGKAMELDPDSDDGGCEDGEENFDLDGVRDRAELDNFLRADDPVTDGECDQLWTGTSKTRFWSRHDQNWTEITIDAEYRLREIRRHQLMDPGPQQGGRRAGDRLGPIVNLSCEGSAFQATWQQRYWTASSSCVCQGTGETVAGPPTSLDGFVHLKTVDWDLTPILGFDVPRDGGLYSVGCNRDDRTFRIDCSCTDSGSWSDATASFPYPAGFGLGNPDTPPRCNHDPQVRSLESGDTRMTGTYSVLFPECAPQGADMTWSLCRAGTPCAPLPPLPGTSIAHPPQ